MKDKWFKISFSILVFMLLALLLNCNNDDTKPTLHTPEGTVWEIIQQDPDFELLVELIAAFPELVTILDDSTDITFFAPKNEAVELLTSTPGFPGDLTLIERDKLKSILLYHMASGAIKIQDLFQASPILTFQGDYIIIVEGNDILLSHGDYNEPTNIITGNIQATNGIIHIPEQVLTLPPDLMDCGPLFSIYGKVMLGAEFTNMRDAILKADSVVPVGEPSIKSILSDSLPITFFAPPDRVFELSGISIHDFTESEWRAILLYHTIQGLYPIAELIERDYETMQGENIYLTDAQYINGAEIVYPDIPPCNGVIHVNENLLLPGVISGGNIMEVIKKNGYDSMAVAIEIADLANELKEGIYTVLVPSNQAFIDFLTENGLKSMMEIPENEIKDIIRHHVMTEYYFTSDFKHGDAYAMLADSIQVVVEDDGQTFRIVDGQGNDPINMVRANIKTTNGVIHEVDKVLIPR